MLKMSSICAVIALSPIGVSGTECHVDKEAANQVIFYSDAPLEDIEGSTDHIDGYVYWPGDKLNDNIDYSSTKFYFEVKLATLDTGIGLRNRHMREKYLETDEFPYTSYEGMLTNVRPISETQYEITTEGTFTVHGQTDKIGLKVVVEDTGDGYLVSGGFELNLKDYGIKVPRLMFLKVSEVIEVKFNFVLKTVKN